MRGDLLFERFISTERDEPPDIDVDFEHERREEVIQYIYEKYGRERAGIAATVISYRGRSAIREVGKVFGLSEDMIGTLSSSIWGGGGGAVSTDAVKRTGLDPASPRMQQVLSLAREINGFPRHLSQHVGGFVITRSRLDEVMPIGNAAMADRTFVEWDKDDLDALGILKIDVLGLGMLCCLRKALNLMQRHYPEVLPSLPSTLWGGSTAEDGRGGGPLTLAAIPPEDPAVYRMLSRADSLGVFQVESRAQMTMLPRLKPRTFYDLVIEVAIVRPGPIQGNMVHPYLRRRQGLETAEYPKPAYGEANELEPILKKTLGVPLFQEQAMKIAIVAGGFTPGEADKLRRAMATFKRIGTIGTFRDKMVGGMLAKGYQREFAERCFGQIEGFGEYGFPESHAASFAILVYASAWLKCHYPDVFAAALLNAQPMGFYAPSQIVRDVREHGVEVRPPDINFSDWDSTLEPGTHAAGHLHTMHNDMRGDVQTTYAIRLGLREIKGMREEDANLIVEKRSSPLLPRSEAERWGGVGGGGHFSFDKPVSKEPPTPAAPNSGLPEFGLKGASRINAACVLPTLPTTRNSAWGEGKKTPYDSVRDLWLRIGLAPRVLERLADADAFGSLGLTRRDALWAAKALGRVGDRDDDLPLFMANAGDAPLNSTAREPDVALPPMPIGEEVVNDYRFLRLSLRAHPAQFLRDDLARHGIVRNETLRTTASGRRVRVSGLVTCRQRPGSANGVVFMTIEDETSLANVIIWPTVFERCRPIVLGARYVAVRGPVQSESGVIHLVAEDLEDLTPWLAQLADHGATIDGLARCDEVRRPIEEMQRTRAQGGRESRLQKLIREMPELAADLNTPARGSAHTPAKRARS